MISKKSLYVEFFLLITICQFSVSADEFVVSANDGEGVFLKYCAGCHGFEGKASYEHAPSFSMGDRLQKDDRELLQSVLNGKNSMPSWKNKLPLNDLRNAVAYLRLLHERYTKGESPRRGDMPEEYYLFKPISESDMQWSTDPVK